MIEKKREFMQEFEGDKSYLIAYNGLDADVVVPDVVPDSYPAPGLRGTRIVALEWGPFKETS